MTPLLFFSFEGNIWKLRADSFSSNLALEVRQREALQTTFWVIDTRKGTMQLPAFQTEARWWTGLEEACNGFLLLHGYEQKSQTGRHIGLQAISQKSGQTIWEKPDLTFKALTSLETLVAENKLGKLLEVQVQSGEARSFSGTAAQANNQSRAFEKQRNAGLLFPVPYLPQDEHFGLLQEFIREKTGQQAQQTIEYLETAKGIFLSFYAKNQSGLANFLLACSLSGQVLLLECLESKVAGLGSDTFFIFAEKLFFIQEKSAIAGYLL